MSQIKPTSAATIAAAIVADLESRTGFKQLFQEISAGVKNEIQEKITTLIVDAREEADAEAKAKADAEAKAKADPEAKAKADAGAKAAK